MLKSMLCLASLGLLCSWAWAEPAPGPWRPIFKGIDHATGTNTPGTAGNFPRLQVVQCVRVDLADADVRLLATPQAPNPVPESRETLTDTVPGFLKKNQLQVACDANFYNATPGGADPTSAGLSCEVFGLEISTGAVVSAQSATDASHDPRFASLLFTTNNEPRLVFVNRPPGTNIAGIYNAITGYYPIVSNGVNIGAAVLSAYPDSYIHQVQPRTAFGLSQDNRYLYLMTIDGRQSGYSDGALDTETAYWMLQFGAWNAINMDGGGSTALYMADTTGEPIALNHSSYVAARGRERYIGSAFGVYAKPLPGFINDINAVPGDTSATISWTTVAPATTQVQYGLTPDLGLDTELQSEMVTNHSVVLSGLMPATGYYFVALSSDGARNYQSPTSYFVTTATGVFDLTNSWSFMTANLDGINWTATNYDDSGWDGSGPGLLWVDTGGAPNPDIPVPMNTEMPFDPATFYPYTTYYLRTHFEFTNSVQGASLVFSNYIDDAAVFYLNGVEIYRLRMPPAPTPIDNSTLASSYACGGNATCSTVFLVSGDPMTNLLAGDNLLAAEVHNYDPRSPDITFGVALSYGAPSVSSPQLAIALSGGIVTLSWDAGGFALESSEQPTGPWAPVIGPSGPVVISPFSLTNSGLALYFRLRR